MRYHSNKVDFFCSFFEKIENTKRHFEINWPLSLQQKSKEYDSSLEDFEKIKTTPFDDYCVKCRTLYTVCELLETNPQDANTSRQLVKYCIENLQDVQNQANLKKVRVRIPLKI